MSAADMLDADPTTIDLSIGPPPPPAVSTSTDADTDWPADELPETPEVPEAVVRGILASAGTVLAMTPLADPDVAEHWHFTGAELDALTPPVTRIVNARPALRAAAARGDEVTVLVQLAGYGGRNLIAGSIARRARAAQLEEWETNGVSEPEVAGTSPRGNGDARPGPSGVPDAGTPGAVGYGITSPAD